MRKEGAYKVYTDKIFILLCLILVIAVGVCVYALPHADFSAEENRVLSDFPRISAKGLASGKFFSQLSAFYADRIPFRRTMIRIKATCELTLGKSENNGVLFLSDGRLADRCEYEETDTLEKNLERIKEFSDGTEKVYALVPRSVDIYFGGELSEQITDTVYSRVPDGARLFESLKQNAGGEDGVYYKTDHHLNAAGAYLLYEYVVRSLGDEPYGVSDFEACKVTDGFLGSAYSSGGLLAPVADSITLYRYEGDGDISVVCDDSGCGLNSLYCPEKLSEKDKYAVFLGGNHGVLHITAEGENRKKLFIVKDSFANAVIPLLARHYDLTVADPRYAEACVSTDADATVIIMGIDTLANGTPLFLSGK